MKVRKQHPALRGLTLTVLLLAVSAHAGDRQMEVGTPPETIRKRAAREKAPLWKIPLGAALVDDMRLLSAARLLISLRKHSQGYPNQAVLLVDTVAGKILWRYDTKKRKGDFQSLLVLEDLLVFRGDRGRKTELITLNTATGQEMWTATFKRKDSPRFYPHAGAGLILVEEKSKRKLTLSGLSLRDGVARWKREFKIEESGSRFPPPIPTGQDVWSFYNGVERLSGSDGSTQWSHNDIRFENYTAPPQADGKDLLVLGADGRLSTLDASTGSVGWTAMLPRTGRYSNIYPDGEKLYVRGELTASGEAAMGGGSHILLALQRENGKTLWTYGGNEPSVSNLMEFEGRLYFGTPTSLVALETDSGRHVFSFRINKTSQPYPVRVRVFPDKAIYIGELIVAACNPETGEKVFAHGMSPISTETYLAGLNSAIPKLQEEMSRLSGGQRRGNSSGGVNFSSNSYAKQQIQRYQNMSNSYHRRASSYRSQGKFSEARYYRSLGYMQSQAAGITAQIDQSFQQMQASVNLMFSVLELRASLLRAFETAAVQAILDRQLLFRKSILSAYALGEDADYVYRPNQKYRSATNQFVTLSVVHLPTGRRRDTYLSPSYFSYGLWNVADLERGVVYHHGLGLDPADYHFSKARNLPPYGKAKTVESFLIAAPIRVPK